MRNKFFNPVKNDVENIPKEEKIESKSAMVNDNTGSCPKCGTAYGTARIAENEVVFHCKSCRVTSPIHVEL